MAEKKENPPGGRGGRSALGAAAWFFSETRLVAAASQTSRRAARRTRVTVVMSGTGIRVAGGVAKKAKKAGEKAAYQGIQFLKSYGQHILKNPG